MLEVCVESLHGAAIAWQYGAHRIELSQRLEVGGVSPERELILAVRRMVPLRMIVLIRCRPGDFIYSDDEKRQMREQCHEAIQCGADGIAIGGLTANGELDLPFLRSVRSYVPDCELVIHRAFDQVADPKQAMEQLLDIGIRRILTSGGPATALLGTSKLRSLQEWSQGRMEILPAGGITPSNAQRILESTGTNQLHGSFRNPSEATSTAMHPYGPWIAEVSKLFQ